MADVVITCPLSVMLPRKTMPDRKYIINKNNERNWHYIVSNKIKQVYKEALREQLEGLTFTHPIKLKLVYFKASNRRSDRTNVLSQHEKFAADAMVEFGCIPDDNDDIILSSHFELGVDLYNFMNIVGDIEATHATN